MTTLNIILLIIIYILLMIVSYRPFKRFSDNEYSDSPKGQVIFAPVMWTMYIIIACIEGFKHMWNNKN